MKIEAVTTSVNYADFLDAMLQENHGMFDREVVVTTKEDCETHRVCEKYGIQVVDCPYFTKGETPFNKPLGINFGLAHLSCTGWMVHRDADTVLPQNFRNLVANAELDETSIYGVDRVDCPSWEEWQKYLAEQNPHKKHYLVHAPRGWKHGSRLKHDDYGGFAPIGFFQMWNAKSGVTRYPVVVDGTAEHSDMLHSLRWPRGKRHIIPEIIAIHLESEQGPMGVNWRGRKTKPFGPPLPPEKPGHCYKGK